jgi:hypothetical protein
MPNAPKSALERFAKSTLWTEAHSGRSRGSRGQIVGDGVPPWKTAKLSEALAYGSHATATVRVRNSADTAYEDGTETVEVYPPDLMASGDSDVPSGTIVKIEFLCDPRHPHWVATNWPCVQE